MRRRATRSRAGAAEAFEPRERVALRRALLAWYRRRHRDLPWRRTRDPYAIWLSEIMLQQTRVETVRPYYERFVARFPNARSLAAAALDDVLALWSGLGYYARGRNLHRAARRIVQERGGRVPETYAELLTLPGVGRYTAAAIASIAFGEPVAAVDGNVKRVLARLALVREPIDTVPVGERLQRIADELLARRAPGDFNQALMELGATICTPKNPSCRRCPLRNRCRAAQRGSQSTIPQRRPKRAPRDIQAAAAAIWRDDRLLLVQRRPRGLLGGLWELPGVEVDHGASVREQLAAGLQSRFGVRAIVQTELGAVEHTFTHRRWRVHVWRCATRTRRPLANDHARAAWFAPERIAALPLATVDRKIIRCALAAESIHIEHA